MTRREHATIVGDILSAIDVGHGGASPLNLTQLANRTNLPFDRLVNYLDELEGRGLVVAIDGLALTEEGRELLHTYNQWSKALVRAGIVAGEDDEKVAEHDLRVR